jgi:hypothetical protein
VVPGRLRPGLPSLEHQLLADAQAAHQAMAAVRPLVEGREFHLQIGLLQINKVPLLSYASASAQLNVEHTPAVQLVACFAGDAWPAAPGAWWPVAGAEACWYRCTTWQ